MTLMLFLWLLSPVFLRMAPIGVGENLIPNMSERILTDPFSFLEELISNSLDAIYRRRTAIPGKYSAEQFDIEISTNKSQITIRDFGCGISEDDLLNKLSKIGSLNDNEGIGEFGWGFYTIFAACDSCSFRSKTSDKVLKAFFRKPQDGNGFEYDFETDPDFAIGTEMVLNLKPQFVLTESELMEKVSHMFIEDYMFMNTDIKLRKSAETIDAELSQRRLDLQKDLDGLRSEISEIQNQISVKTARAQEIPAIIDKLTLEMTKKDTKEGEPKDFENLSDEQKNLKNDKAKEGENLTDDQKNEKGENLTDDQKSEKAKEGENLTDDQKKEEIRQLTEELNTINEEISKLKEKLTETEKALEEKQQIKISINDIPLFKPISLHPWTDAKFQDDLITFAKDRLNLTNIQFASHFEITFEHLENKPTFKANLFIPKYDNNPTMQKEFNNGSMNIFITGCRMPLDSYFKNSNLLKGCHIIMKSNNAALNSLRTAFKDKKLYQAIADELLLRILSIFMKQKDDVVHNYERILKSNFLDIKRAEIPNNIVLKKFKNVLSFMSNTNEPITLHNLSKLLDRIQKNVSENNTTQEDKDKNVKDSKDNVEDGYERGDAIYFTTIPSSLAKLPNPVLDGIKAPFIFINTLLDEQIIQDLKEFEIYKLTNLSQKTFTNYKTTNAAEYKPLLEFTKETLKPFISNCLLSEQLIECPMKIVQDEYALSTLVRSAIGTNDIEKNPMRMFFDKKPTLHINPNHEDIKALQNMNDNDKKTVIQLLFFATATSSCIEPYSKLHSYTVLTNIAKDITKTEKFMLKENENPFDAFNGSNFMEMMQNMDFKAKNEEDMDDESDSSILPSKEQNEENDELPINENQKNENDELFRDSMPDDHAPKASTEGVRDEL